MGQEWLRKSGLHLIHILLRQINVARARPTRRCNSEGLMESTFKNSMHVMDAACPASLTAQGNWLKSKQT